MNIIVIAIKYFMAGVFLLATHISLVYAQVDEAPKAYTPPQSYQPGHVANLSEVFLTLLLVVGLIFLLAWLFKRTGYHQFSSQSAIKVKSCLPLSSKEKLLIIEVDGEQLLIGVAPGYIGKIKKLKAPLDNTDKSQPTGFSKTLSQLLQGPSKLYEKDTE